MPQLTYSEILGQIRYLTLEEQARLLEELAGLVHARIKALPKHSVLEFKGIAGDFWQDVDIKQFIEEERNSWDRD
ncbi:MAG TPA: hypothetical protein VGT44_09510 [Ktedonobacteraceae bacterium]|nr:hypothetical protein [Ktedonobacteraceae bacterium]